MDKELRTLNTGCEIRALTDEETGVTTITGYAAVFNERSENLGGFREVIEPTAFDGVLNDDVRALFNHDSNFVLGRNGTTLKLTIDERGLKYDIEAPQTQLVKDMVISPMLRGDVNQSSFAFRVSHDGDEWKEDEEGVIVRTIKKVSKLFDVSPVTYPAYTAASSTLRSLDELSNKGDNTKDELKDAVWRSSVNRYLDTL